MSFDDEYSKLLHDIGAYKQSVASLHNNRDRYGETGWIFSSPHGCVEVNFTLKHCDLNVVIIAAFFEGTVPQLAPPELDQFQRRLNSLSKSQVWIDPGDRCIVISVQKLFPDFMGLPNETLADAAIALKETIVQIFELLLEIEQGNSVDAVLRQHENEIAAAVAPLKAYVVYTSQHRADDFNLN